MMSRRERFLSFAALDEIDRPQDTALAPPARTTIAKPAELTWWDWAVFLLHTAAEIEHTLLVQYLYAAYSLASSDFVGSDVPPNAATLTRRWRSTIIGIAQEEMAHLLTEQNLLRFIDGPLNFEREDFPFHTFLYPFMLELEPLSKTSLAKYVAAEMHAAPRIPPDELTEIVGLATKATHGMPVNRVGVLFDTLVEVFDDPMKLSDTDLRSQTVTEFQADPDDWRAFGDLVVRKVSTRDAALDALTAIGKQGEGSAIPSPEEPPSHFDRLLDIYRQFPDNKVGKDPMWVPTRPIPVNPNTSLDPVTDPASERARITHPTTLRWAQLYNVRYRMLLANLAHALYLPGPLRDSSGSLTVRGQLKDWTFDQMDVLRRLTLILTSRLLKQAPAPHEPVNAGPPFELPYSLGLADDERGRWRLHLAGRCCIWRSRGRRGRLICGLVRSPGPARRRLPPLARSSVRQRRVRSGRGGCSG
jgi:hypothetical protein